MTSVLISIKPKWCELIASGKKTVEVRKTRPKLETPFKVYIYCTQARMPVRHNGRIVIYEDDLAITNRRGQGKRVENPCGSMMEGEFFLNGKVIGEFVCDSIEEIGFSPEMHGMYVCPGNHSFISQSCICFEEMFDYLGEEYGYGWHISDLVIYDEPRNIWEFCKPCDPDPQCDCRYCITHGRSPSLTINRAPQSWCYVEGRGFV